MGCYKCFYDMLSPSCSYLLTVLSVEGLLNFASSLLLVSRVCIHAIRCFYPIILHFISTPCFLCMHEARVQDVKWDIELVEN